MTVIAPIPQVRRATTRATSYEPRSFHVEHGALQRSAWPQLTQFRTVVQPRSPAQADCQLQRRYPGCQTGESWRCIPGSAPSMFDQRRNLAAARLDTYTKWSADTCGMSWASSSAFWSSHGVMNALGKWITAKTSNLTRSRASGRPLAAPSGMYLAAAVLPTPQLGNAEAACGTPQHPYTEALLSSLPRAA